MALDWNKTMVIIMAVFLIAMALKTFSEPTTIDGYSVYGNQVDEQRTTFSMVALLGVIFAFFGLFLIVVLKRLDHRRFE